MFHAWKNTAPLLLKNHNKKNKIGNKKVEQEQATTKIDNEKTDSLTKHT
jgi:hypothetical protein